ncbi:hypothetical protein [Deinococcus planocerae]|uniref:hypothetical protein n=1 Tax=Deinococcus planocerae TaxID=1737569 RepID=UPI0011AED045|nr:hypothetical protein [Deinococcus planocerae]
MTPAVKPQRVPVLVKWRGRPSRHVCFECRKQFRKPLTFQAARSPSGNLFNVHGLGMGAATYPCPQCGQPMTVMGKNFRAPAQADAEGWEVARRLAAAGFRHGHTTGRKYPTRLKDVNAFLEENMQRTDGEELLRKWGKK